MAKNLKKGGAWESNWGGNINWQQNGLSISWRHPSVLTSPTLLILAQKMWSGGKLAYVEDLMPHPLIGCRKSLLTEETLKWVF